MALQMIGDRNGSAGTTFNQLDQEWARRLAKKGCYKKGPIQKTGKYPFVSDYKLQRTLFNKSMLGTAVRAQRLATI